MPKTIISPAQGLLIIMDYYQDNLPKEKMEHLKRLYLSGANSIEDIQLFDNFLSDPVLEEYEINKNYKTINDDPTRRYFETHLAYETLNFTLTSLGLIELTQYFNELEQQIQNSCTKYYQDYAYEILSGDLTHEISEYVYNIHLLNNNEIFKEFSDEERQKILLLVKIAFLGMINTVANKTPLPLDIYGKDIFSETSRGKLHKIFQDSTRNSSFGILKGEMPVSLDDIAHNNITPPYRRASESSNYLENAEWVRQNFSQLVHPFSNSISGTILAQLRTIAGIEQDGYSVSQLTLSTSQFKLFLKNLISTLLYLTGGHSLNEYTAVICVPDVQQYFTSTLAYTNFDKINLVSMFYTDNKTAFDAALESTIKYNRHILRNAQLHNELLSAPTLKAIDQNTLATNRDILNKKIWQESLYSEQDNTQFELRDKTIEFCNKLDQLSELLSFSMQNYINATQMFFFFFTNLNLEMSNQLQIIIDFVINHEFTEALQVTMDFKTKKNGEELVLLNTIIEDLNNLKLLQQEISNLKTNELKLDKMIQNLKI